jgi:DNA-binding response OmpR family regulator
VAHILIVDDEETVRDIIAAALTLAGYQVETAGNG